MHKNGSRNFSPASFIVVCCCMLVHVLVLLGSFLWAQLSPVDNVNIFNVAMATLSRLKCPLEAAQTLGSHTLQCEYIHTYVHTLCAKKEAHTNTHHHHMTVTWPTIAEFGDYDPGDHHEGYASSLSLYCFQSPEFERRTEELHKQLRWGEGTQNQPPAVLLLQLSAQHVVK